MNVSVLFDVPGPRTRARHRWYSLAVALVLVAAAYYVLRHLDDEGEFAYALWEPFLAPTYIRAVLIDGLLQTLSMAVTAVFLAVVFGTVFGVAKLSDHRWLRVPCTLIVEFFRAVPGLLLMVFIFLAYGAGDGGIGSYWSVVLALTLFHGAVFAEVFRAGVLAVDRGQGEASSALGLRKTQTMVFILLPQAVRIMLPALISQCVVVLKDTSLGMYVLAPGLTEIGKQIWNEFGNQLQTATVIAALYISANLVLTWVATMVQKRLVGEKKLQVPGPGGFKSRDAG